MFCLVSALIIPHLEVQKKTFFPEEGFSVHSTQSPMSPPQGVPFSRTTGDRPLYYLRQSYPPPAQNRRGAAAAAPLHQILYILPVAFCTFRAAQAVPLRWTASSDVVSGQQQPPQPLLQPQPLPQPFPLQPFPQQQHRMRIKIMIHRQPPPPKPLLQHPIDEVPPVMKSETALRRAQSILCTGKERVTDRGCQISSEWQPPLPGWPGPAAGWSRRWRGR